MPELVSKSGNNAVNNSSSENSQGHDYQAAVNQAYSAIPTLKQPKIESTPSLDTQAGFERYQNFLSSPVAEGDAPTESDSPYSLSNYEQALYKQQSEDHAFIDAYSNYSSKTSPEGQMHKVDLAATLGLPPSVIDQDPQRYTQLAKWKKSRDYLKAHPELVSFIKANPAVFMAMQHDETNALSYASRSFGDHFGAALDLAKLDAQRSDLYRQVQQNPDMKATDEQQKQIDELNRKIALSGAMANGAGGFWGSLVGGMKEAMFSDEMLKSTIATTAIGMGFGGIAGAGINLGRSAVTGIASGIARGLTLRTLAQFVGTVAPTVGFSLYDYNDTKGRTFGDLVEAGVDPFVAADKAGTAATSAATLDVIGGGLGLGAEKVAKTGAQSLQKALTKMAANTPNYVPKLAINTIAESLSKIKGSADKALDSAAIESLKGLIGKVPGSELLTKIGNLKGQAVGTSLLRSAFIGADQNVAQQMFENELFNAGIDEAQPRLLKEQTALQAKIDSGKATADEQKRYDEVSAQLEKAQYRDILYGVDQAAMSGAVMNSVISTSAMFPQLVMDSFQWAHNRQYNKAAHEAVDAILDNSKDILAKGGKTSVQTFNQIGQLLGLKNYYVDPTQIREIMDKNPEVASQIKQRLLEEQNIDFDAELQKAEESGQDLEFSTGNMWTYFYNSDLKKDFQKISSSARGMLSDAELDARIKESPDVIKEAAADMEAKAQEDAIRAQELREVQISLRKELKDSVPQFKDASAGEIRRNAVDMISGFIDNYSRRMGLKPKEFMEKYGLHYKSFDLKQIESQRQNGEVIAGQYDSSANTVFFNGNATVATVMHETAHWFLDMLDKISEAAPLVEDMSTVYEMLGTNADDFKANKEKYHEKFAYLFEKYLSQPTDISDPKAKGLLDFVKNQMVTNYEINAGGLEGQYTRQTGDKLPPISSKIKDFFDGLLFNRELLQTTQDLGFLEFLSPDVMKKLSGKDQYALNKAKNDVLAEALAYLDEGTMQQTQILTGKAKGILKSQFFEKRKELLAKAKIAVHLTPEQRFADLTRYGYIMKEDGSRYYLPGASKVLNRDAVVDILTDGNPKLIDTPEVARILKDLNSKHLLGTDNNSVDPRTCGDAFLFSDKSYKTLIQAISGTRQDSNETRSRERMNRNTDPAVQFRYMLTYGEGIGSDGMKHQLFEYKRGIDRKELEEYLKQQKFKNNKRVDAAGFIKDRLTSRQLMGKTGEAYSIAEIAEALGTQDFKTLIQNVANAPDLELQEARMVKQGLLNEYKDLLDPSSETDLIARMLNTEAATRYYTILERALGRTKMHSRKMQLAQKAMSERIMRTLNVRDLQPNRFYMQERKAWRIASRFIAKGDLAQASIYLAKAGLNNELRRRAIEVKNEVDRAIKICRRLESMAPESFDTNFIRVAKYLKGVVFGTMTDAKENALLNVPMEKNQPMAYARLQEIKAKDYPEIGQMTVAQLEDFSSELVSLVMMARGQKQLILDGQTIDVRKVVDPFVEHSTAVNKSAKLSDLGVKQAPSWIERGLSKITNSLNKTRNAESILEVLGGVKKGTHNDLLHYIFAPIRSRSVHAERRTKDINEKITNIISKLNLFDYAEPFTFTLHNAEGSTRSTYTFNANRMGRGELFMLLLNAGNMDNWKKTVLGGRTKNGGRNEIDANPWGFLKDDGSLDDVDMQDFLGQLIDKGVITKDWFDAAQRIWDLFKEEEPKLQNAYYAAKGKYYKPITADFTLSKLVEDKFGQDFADSITGGYMPIRYDDILHDRRIDAQVDDVLAGDPTEFVPDTQNGFLKDRTDGVFGGVSLDLKNIYNAFSKQIWFEELQPVIQNVNKIFTDPQFVSEVQRVDPGIMVQLKAWLGNVAQRQSKARSTDPWIEKLSQVATSRATMTIMSGNFPNVIQQIAGLQVALLKINGKQLIRAFGQYLRNPLEQGRAITDVSEYMRTRKFKDNIRDMKLARQKAYVTGEKGKANAILDSMSSMAYALQTLFQGTIDNVTYIAALNDFMETNAGKYSKEELTKRAREHADSVVATTQSSNRVEDLSTYQASANSWQKLFRMFTSYFVMLRNLNSVKRAEYEQAGFGKNTARLAAFVSAYYMPFVLGEVIMQAMRGTYSGDDGLEEMEKTLAQQLYTAPLTSMFPMTGGFISGLATTAMGSDNTFVGSRNQSPSSAAISVGANLITKNPIDGQWNEKDIAWFFDMATYITGVPMFEWGKNIAKGSYLISQDKGGDDLIDKTNTLLTGKAH